MSKLEEKLKVLIANSPKSTWKERVEWSKANRDWLLKSSDIALRILDALEDLSWNKARLAKEMGVSPQQVSKYVKGDENFKLETLCKLEKVLGIELVTVLQSDEEVIQKEKWTYEKESEPKTIIKVGRGSDWAYTTNSQSSKETSGAKAA